MAAKYPIGKNLKNPGTAGRARETNHKDGYQVYVTPSQDGRGDVQIAIGTDFLYMNVGNPAKPDEIKKSIEQFMTLVRSAGLLSSEDSFSEFIKKEEDLVMWFGGIRFMKQWMRIYKMLCLLNWREDMETSPWILKNGCSNGISSPPWRNGLR